MAKEFNYPLFSKRGEFVGYTPEQLATAGPKTRERYRAVESAASACMQAEQAEKLAAQSVTDAIAELEAARAAIKAIPQRTRLDEARSMMRQNQVKARPPGAIVR